MGRLRFIRGHRVLRRGSMAGALALFVSAAFARDPQAANDASKLLGEQKYEEAAAAFGALVQANRFDGSYWHNLGFALHSLKRYDDAIAAWEKAIELGNGPANNRYNIACAYALSGRKNEAIAAVQTALNAGFLDDETIRNDSDLDSIREDPEFRRVTGLYPPTGMSRDEQWHYDLDFFARRMEQMHWDLYARVSREDFQAAVRQLREDVARLSDPQLLVRLRRIIASVGDGHTGLRRRPGDKTIARYPLDLYVFSDGLFVRGAPPEQERLVGARVLKIGALDAAEALERTKLYASVDNPMGYLDWGPVLLVAPAMLEAIGAAKDDKSAAYVVQTPSGETITVELEPAQFDPATAARHGIAGYQYANASASGELPLYQRHADQKLWFEYLPESKLVYFHFSAVDDQPGLTLRDCAAAVFACIEKNAAEHLVIDMRLNGGGNTGLIMPLIQGLIGCPLAQRDRGVYVIIGRETFSAAMNTVSVIEHYINPTFVGEPTGSSPNFVGESTSFTLPCSGYPISCSSRYWQHVVSTDRRIWIAPDIVAELSSSDYAQNRDPAMEAIMREIGRAAVSASGQ